jgi:hypothetical protein
LSLTALQLLASTGSDSKYFELAGEGRVILLRHRAVGEASDGLFEFEGRYVCSGTVEPLERQPETAAVGG